jgi:hypothetical protein
MLSEIMETINTQSGRGGGGYFVDCMPLFVLGDLCANIDKIEDFLNIC